MKAELIEVMRSIETSLLTAFHSYSAGVSVRFRKIEADVSNLDAATSARLAALEERVLTLEMHLIPSPLEAAQSTVDPDPFWPAFRAVVYDLPSRVGPTGALIGMVILAETIGRQERQEWSQLTEEDFARAIHGDRAVEEAKRAGRDICGNVRKFLNKLVSTVADDAKLASILPFERVEVLKNGRRTYAYRFASDGIERIHKMPTENIREKPQRREMAEQGGNWPRMSALSHQ